MITDKEMDKLLETLSDVAFDMIKEFNPSVKSLIITVKEGNTSEETHVLRI